jgi:hypothetical protein
MNPVSETGFTLDYGSASGSMVEVQQTVAHLPAAGRETIAAYLKAVPARREIKIHGCIDRHKSGAVRPNPYAP